MAETLYAAFSDASMAERAAGALLDYGVRKEDVSLVASETYAQTRGAHLTDDVEDYDEVKDPVATARRGISTTTGGDAASGAEKGAAIGAGLGVLAGIASLVVPGFGLVLGGGALATALMGAAGATAAGAVAGGATGYLKDQGVPDEAAQNYNRTLTQGGAVIAVRLPSGKVDRAAAEGVISKYQATHVGAYAPPA